MKKTHLPLDGACIIELDRRDDPRGHFSRLFCADEFKKFGIPGTVAQINRSCSRKKHTLRGMHYQLPPHQESKTICCTKGGIFDVLLDLRPDSETFLRHYGTELDEDDPRLIHVPKGFAHGFLTLKDDTEVVYIVDEPYSPESERGIRWDDPKFNIPWPATPTVVSDRDASHPDFSMEHHLPHATNK